MRDLHELPKFEDGLSYLYVDHCIIEQEFQSIAIIDSTGRTSIPCASLSLLMLGPGTSITHAAIKALADNGCLAIWAGEEGVRYYAQGLGETRNSRRLIRQAMLVSIPMYRTLVAKKMYFTRFHDAVSLDDTIEHLRGKEGARMKQAYIRASELTGVTWTGRQYNRKQWNDSDPVNRALSAANSCLYGICHAAIVSLGYSSGLGFIHTGKMLSFVYDIADLYKTEISIPLAFQIVRDTSSHIATETRKKCRDLFYETRLLKRIPKDIEDVLDIDDLIPANSRQSLQDIPDFSESFDDDGDLPGYLWDPSKGSIKGGENYTDLNQDDKGV